MTFLPEDIIEGETIVVPLSSSQNLLQTIGKHDPLALVCYWLKINLGETIYGTGGNWNPEVWTICRFLDKATMNSLTEYQSVLEQLELDFPPDLNIDIFTPDEESIEEANTIRKYYHLKMSNRVFMNDAPLSSFYQRLLDFFELKDGKIDYSDFGLVAKLPTLYKEDLEYDWLKDNSNPIGDVIRDYIHYPELDTFSNLKFVKRTISRNKSHKYYSYWFWDEEKHLYVIKVDQRNVLLGFINHTVKNSDITIRGTTHIGVIHPNSDFRVYVINKNFELE